MASTFETGTTFNAPAVTFYSGREGTEVTIPPGAATLDGFRNWAKSDQFPERGRISFIDGEVVAERSPENFDLHYFIKGEIYSLLRNVIRAKDLGRLLFDRCLLTNAEAKLSTEPDAMFLSFASYQAGNAEYFESRTSRGSYVELIGSPDWTLEIVSPSSTRKDTITLKYAYFAAGVIEYWIVDATGYDVRMNILASVERAYVPVRARNGWHRSSVFGAEFRITRHKAKDGLWDYTLEVSENS